MYVSGLPPDVTFEELEPIFRRAGVLKLDPETGDSKIRIYTLADGKKCKGDALVSYANPASVELAIKFLHEHELRPNCRLCVQQADFEEHEQKPKLSKAQLQELAASKKGGKDKAKDRAKYVAARNAQKEAVSWTDDVDDGSGRRIVVLKHMFSAQEAETEGPRFYIELANEIKEECEKIGQVAKVTPLERHKLGIVCVKFKASPDAEECIKVMDGRFFGGHTVKASFYDGRTDLRALGGVAPPAAVAPALAPAQPTAPPFARSGPDCGNAADSAEDAAPMELVVGPDLPAAEGPAASSEEVGATTCQPPLAEGDVLEGPDLGPPAGSEAYQDWLDNQSSESDDEEFRIHTEG